MHKLTDGRPDRPLAPLTSFSQASLEDYLECQRRFFLRYRLRLAWPALAAEPVQEHEREADLGAAFHRMIQQHLIGVPATQIGSMISDSQLSGWWQAYLNFAGPDLRGVNPEKNARLFPELILSAPMNGTRLLAKYDLLVLHPDGEATIYDWKTSRRLPGRARLAARMQTRVYRYVLAQAGASINRGKSILPGQIRMVYWFANYPGQPEVLPYDEPQHAQDITALDGLVGEIQQLPEAGFHLTEDAQRCRFCTYRSLCERGVTAGNLDEDLEVEEGEAKSNEDEVDLDFDQIAEIGY